VGPLLLSAPFFIFVWRDFDQALFSQDRRKLPKPWTPSDRGGLRPHYLGYPSRARERHRLGAVWWRFCGKGRASCRRTLDEGSALLHTRRCGSVGKGLGLGLVDTLIAASLVTLVSRTKPVTTGKTPKAT
jgi:hypothetical protein